MRNSFTRLAKFASASALLLAAGVAAAALPQPYNAASFKAAQAAGKPVVVEIHADWCTECQMQDQVLRKMLDEAKYAGYAWLRVDYDRQKDAVKDFKARKESTLVVFKGGREIARATGITAEERIRALVDQAK